MSLTSEWIFSVGDHGGFCEDMTSKFNKLDKFEGNDFRCLQKKKDAFSVDNIKSGVRVVYYDALKKWKMR